MVGDINEIWLRRRIWWHPFYVFRSIKYHLTPSTVYIVLHEVCGVQLVDVPLTQLHYHRCVRHALTQIWIVNISCDTMRTRRLFLVCFNRRTFVLTYQPPPPSPPIHPHSSNFVRVYIIGVRKKWPQRYQWEWQAYYIRALRYYIYLSASLLLLLLFVGVLCVSNLM